MKCVVVIQFLLILGGAQAATMVNKEQVDLPSFLQTITNLRTKLLNLLGNSDPSIDNNKNLNKENLLLAHDLVSDSIFDEEQEKKAEKTSLFENMEGTIHILKFGYSEKATKFEKVFHLKFDATQ